MKKLDMRNPSHRAIMAMALVLNVFIAGAESRGRGGSAASTTADSTRPGPGTGLSGQGKGPSPVLLGKAGEYVILAKTGISTTGSTAITGNLGASPVAASYITGFSLVDPPSTYSTCAMVTGKVYAADYDSPTPANLTTAVLDMQAAYTDAASRAPDYTELGAGNIGGWTLAPAVYKWGTDLLIPADVTLSGGSHDVWIFQIAGNLTQTSGVKVVLKGGALPKNIFWQVAGAADHETTSHFEGIVLSQTAISMKTNATVNGRLLAQTAVTLDANAVVEPGASVPIFMARIPSRSFLVKMPGAMISFRLSEGTGTRISIVDVWGRAIWAKTVATSRGLRELTWDGTNSNGTPAAQGVYLVRMEPLDENRHGLN